METNNIYPGNFGGHPEPGPAQQPSVEDAVEAYLAVHSLKNSGQEADASGNTITDLIRARSSIINNLGPEAQKEAWEKFRQALPEGETPPTYDERSYRDSQGATVVALRSIDSVPKPFAPIYTQETQIALAEFKELDTEEQIKMAAQEIVGLYLAEVHGDQARVDRGATIRNVLMDSLSETDRQKALQLANELSQSQSGIEIEDNNVSKE